MSSAELSEYIRISKYAQAVPGEDRKETWEEQVERVFNMHEQKLVQESFVVLHPEEMRQMLASAKQMMLEKRVLGSQRVLQYAGDPIFKHNMRAYNCVFGYIDRVDAFKEYMYLLLCGCGVGFSVQKHHVSKLPSIVKPTQSTVTYQIPDSIEGWADAVGMLMNSYFGGIGINAANVVEFDYSLIRPEGSPISTGYKAPGPEPLRRALEKIRAVIERHFDPRLELSGLEAISVLRPIDVYDILMHAADAVISGGVRRSATIALFSADDQNMLQAKTGDWFTTNPQRARSNNSAVLLRSKTSFEQFQDIVSNAKSFGEPGFFLVDDLAIGANPCLEITMVPRHFSTGLSGWQACNLCEINGALCKTPEDFYAACRAAAIIGTIQASYTQTPYLGKTTQEILEREALLGVSITGIMDSPKVLLNPEVLQEGARIVKEVNRQVAAALGINPAARTTCVKPAGTTSLLLQTASGIHPHHARRYIRRVQVNVNEAPYQYFKMFNPDAVEKSVWDPNGVTDVISFLCEAPEGAITKDQVSALELLEIVKLVQQNWVIPGTNPELCVIPGTVNNVSNTVNVAPNEWDSVAQYIYENRQYFTGVSLLPSSGDKDYPQAPLTQVPTWAEFLKTYPEATEQRLQDCRTLIARAKASGFASLWEACNLLQKPTLERLAQLSQAQWDWMDDADYMSDVYFGEINNVRLSHLLKDLHNWTHYNDLETMYEPVRWEYFIDTSKTTAGNGEAACAGGSCEVPAEWLAMMKEQTNVNSIEARN